MARRPRLFNDFIGQSRLISFLKKLVQGARRQGSPVISMLLIAGPGQGKSALAKALACEYHDGSKEPMAPTFHRLIAGKGASPQAICRQLQSMRFGDIFFIDEAHSLLSDAQEAIFIALDERKTFALTEDGKLNRSTLTSVADICLILATTMPGRILPALRDRLEVLEFDPYSAHELGEIAKSAAQNSGVAITSQAAHFLAQRCQGSPRKIYRSIGLLQTLHPDIAKFDLDHVRDFLAQQGIDNFGLTPKQREYLRVLADTPGHVASLERLSSALEIDGLFVRRDVEYHLVNEGFIAMTPRGRRLTDKGLAAVHEVSSNGGGMR